MIIKTRKLIFRPYRKSDAIDLFRNFNSKEVTRFMRNAKYPFNLKDAKKWIILKQKLARKRPREEIVFVIEKDGKFIGSIDLKKIERHKAEIGYWIGRKYWNKGITTEAVSAITQFGFKKLKLHRIYAYVFSKNKNSAKVLEKNGFKKEGILRKDIIKDGEFIDMYVYARLKK